MKQYTSKTFSRERKSARNPPGSIKLTVNPIQQETNLHFSTSALLWLRTHAALIDPIRVLPFGQIAYRLLLVVVVKRYIRITVFKAFLFKEHKTKKKKKKKKLKQQGVFGCNADDLAWLEGRGESGV